MIFRLRAIPALVVIHEGVDVLPFRATGSGHSTEPCHCSETSYSTFLPLICGWPLKHRHPEVILCLSELGCDAALLGR